MPVRPNLPPGTLDIGLLGKAMLEAATAARIGVTVSTMGPEGTRNIYVSDIAADICGWSASELLEGDPMRMIASEDLGWLASLVADWQAGKSAALHYELRVRTRDGTTVPIAVSATDVRLDGRPAVLSFIFDRRAAKTAEQTRARTEARFRELIEKAPEGIAITVGDRFAYANQAVVEMLRVASAEELYARPLATLVVAEDRAALQSRVKVLLDGQLPRGPVQIYRSRRPDGSTAVLEASSVPFEYEDKPAILTLLRDVTERRALEARLVQADRLAALGTMAAGVAHEINNPLAYLMLNLDWISRRLALGPPDAVSLEAMKDMLHEARGGAERVAAIVQELRSFSRNDSEKRHAVDLAEVVRSAIKIAGHEIRPRARIVTSFSEVPPVWANEGRVEQVVINLLLNAAQALPEIGEGNEIRISVRADASGRAVLEVADNGEGIPTDVLPRIFDPFFTTKPPGVGTGLGLSICHGIVGSLGGQITARSEPGEGTTFRVTLPATPLGGSDSEPVSEAAPPRIGKRARVLIVDDEAHIAYTMRELLSSEHDVVAVTTAEEALTALRANAAFDVILCDLMMPGVTGIELYGRIREEWSGLEKRVVFMTGGAFTPRAAEFLASIDNRRIEKPFKMSVVERLVRELQKS